MEQILKLTDSIQRLNRRLCSAIESAGVLSLLLIMAVTVLDVIGAKVFLKPVPGAMDIVTLAQTVAVSFCAAATLIAGGHVSVEIFIQTLPPSLKQAALILGNLLSLILCALIVWRLMVYGQDLRLEGEVSPTARFPLYPFAWGIALGMVPACIELCTRIIRLSAGRKAGSEQA